MSSVHPGMDDGDPTVEMPRVNAAAAPGPYVPPPVEEAILVEGPGPRSPRRVGATVVRPVAGNPLGYTFARFVAFVLDQVLVAGVLTILAYALIAINPITGLPTNTQRGFDATLAMGVVLAFVYGVTAEALTGTTIGKLALGLHVVALREPRVGFARAFVRALLRPIDLLGLGIVLTILPGHRRLGDLAAGTAVVRQSPLRGYAPYVGWLAVVVIAAIPPILVGVPRTLAGVIAFVEFAPGIGARIALLAHHALAALPH